MALCGVDANWVRSRAELEWPEVRRRRQLFMGTRPAGSLMGKTAVVVDDGLATGTTMRAAIQAIRTRNPAQVVVAVPVAPLSVIEGLRTRVDGVVCLRTPELFEAVGLHYVRFPQVEDEEVCAALKTPSSVSEAMS
jgi:putative phosphoribosyl transferase